MRRRSTYIPNPDVDYDPSELKIEGQHLSFSGLKAAREERLTFGLQELPPVVAIELQKVHELHVRWQSEEAYSRASPFLSGLTPGLHIYYSPLNDQSHHNVFPQLLLDFFSSTAPRLQNVSDAFTRPHLISERFASTASLQYYASLPSLQQVVTWVQRNVCTNIDVVCKHNAALLNLAAYVDFDYDSISHALTVSAHWSKPPAVLMDPIGEWTTYDCWNMALDASPSDRNEVGVLMPAPAAEPADLRVEGFLTVVGEDTEPKPTMFFFPSRHHELPHKQRRKQQYTVSFDTPTGLHPTMRITILSPPAEPETKPAGSTCALHTYLTLPSVLFADEYALPTTDRDPLFTEAHNIVSLRSYNGERDLEAPDYVIKKWGSALLLELASPASYSQNATSSWDVTIPLHLRYLPPIAGGRHKIEIPWPIVFWACTAEEGTKFTVNPFDRTNLGYDGLFGTRTMFYHLEPRANARLVESINVPVVNTDVMSHSLAEILTMVLVLGGFLWVAAKVVRQMAWEAKWWSEADQQDREKKKQ